MFGQLSSQALYSLINKLEPKKRDKLQDFYSTQKQDYR